MVDSGPKRWWSRGNLGSPPLTSTPGTQLTAEQPLMERTRAYQKRCSASKDIKKKPQWDGRTGTLAKWCNPIPPGAQSTGWRIIILQKFSHRSDSSKPHIRLPGLGGLAWGRGGAPRAFGFEGQQGLIAGAPGDWEKQRLHSWKAHTGSFTCWDPGQTQ